MNLGFDVIGGLSLLLILVLEARVFLYVGFLPPHKPRVLNFKFII